MRSVSWILLFSCVEQPNADSSISLLEKERIQSFPRSAKNKVTYGSNDANKYPPLEEQLPEIEDLQQQAREIISVAREAGIQTAKALKAAQGAEAQLLTAIGEEAQATAVASLADSVIAAADWVVETVVTADKINTVAQRAIEVAPPVNPELSEEKRRELAKRVMQSWTSREAKQWGAMMMGEATKIKSESTSVGKSKARALLRAVAGGETQASEVYSLAIGAQEGIGRQAAAIQERAEMYAKFTMHKTEKSLPFVTGADLEMAAKKAAAAMIAEEETQKALVHEAHAEALAQVETARAASRFRSSQNTRHRGSAQRIRMLFADMTDNRVSIFYAAALFGLFTGSGITFARLRFSRVLA